MKKILLILGAVAPLGWILAADAPKLADFKPIERSGQTRTIFLDTFDNGNRGWNDFFPEYKIARGDGVTGSGAMSVARTPEMPYRFTFFPLDATPGKRYRVTAECRAEGVVNALTKSKAQAFTSMSAEFNRNKQWLCSVDGNVKLVDGNCDWTKINFEFTPPATSDHTDIALYLPKNCGSGKVFWDNLKIEELGEEPPMIYPILPKCLALAGDGYAKFRVFLPAGGEKKLFLFATVAGKEFASQVRDGVAEFKFGALPAGKHEVKLALGDAETNRITGEEAYVFTVPDRPAPKGTVTTDADGRFFVDGKPFFPLGVFIEHPNVNEQDFARFKEAGLNFGMVDSARNLRLPDNNGEYGVEAVKRSLDVFEQHDFKVMVGMFELAMDWNEKYKGLTNKTEIAARLVDAVKDHPAVLGWYISDENPGDKLAPVRNLRQLVSGLDPFHPVATLTDKPGDYVWFAPTGDFLMMDKYPIYDAKSQSMETIRVCFEVADKCSMGKWFVPQAFNWGSFKQKEPFHKFRYPTALEMKSQALLALNNGVRGFCYYSYSPMFRQQESRDPGSSKWFWPMFCLVTHFVKDLEPYFLSTAPIESVKVESSGKSFVEAKRHTANGKSIVVVTSDGPDEAKAVVHAGKAGLTSRFGLTKELGGGKYEFVSENMSSDILE